MNDHPLSQNIFGLVDCNNFFVSCERVFRPELMNTPVVVLSNNDGCAISRSNEAKALGIKMGQPLFEFKDIVQKHNVKLFSPNFSLYQDMSFRVIDVISKFVEKKEVYSIDECFIDLSQFINKMNELNKFSKTIVTEIKKQTGIPVFMGIGTTKTLAKCASNYGKKHSKGFSFFNSVEQNKEFLMDLDISDVWGIGWAYTKKLKELGIDNAYKFSKLEKSFVHNYMKTLGVNTLLELNDTKCYNLKEHDSQKKSIATTRTFSKKINNYSDMSAVISTFASSCAASLRKENSKCRIVSVFIRSDKSYKIKGDSSFTLSEYTNYTPDIIKGALECLKKSFIPNTLYKRAGVILYDICDKDFVQLNFFTNPKSATKNETLINAIDKINQKYHSKKIMLAIEKTIKKEIYNCKMKSPNYTMNWSEVPKCF